MTVDVTCTSWKLIRYQFKFDATPPPRIRWWPMQVTARGRNKWWQNPSWNP